MRVTAVIPAFNRAAFIGEAIESVLAQTRPVDEVLIVDDCSTDDTVAVASRYPVRVVALPVNRGSSGARNAGIREATGDAIAWLDSDDIWLPFHCERTVTLLEEFPGPRLPFLAWSCSAIVSSCCPTTMACGLQPVSTSDRYLDVFWPSFLHGPPVPMITAVIRTEALRQIGGFDEELRAGVDADLFLRLAERHRFVCIHDITARYRLHGSQITAQRGHQQRTAFMTRVKLARHARTTGEPATAALYEARLLECWDRALWAAWMARDVEQVRMLSALAPLMPGTTAAGRYFRLRRFAPRWLLGLWDWLPKGRG